MLPRQRLAEQFPPDQACDQAAGIAQVRGADVRLEGGGEQRGGVGERRHLRQLNHGRFACQSSPSGGPFAGRTGRITARSLLVHRTITG